MNVYPYLYNFPKNKHITGKGSSLYDPEASLSYNSSQAMSGVVASSEGVEDEEVEEAVNCCSR